MNGATPFMRAVESSKVDVVQYLVERGAKLQIENKKGMFNRQLHFENLMVLRSDSITLTKTENVVSASINLSY